MVRRTEDAAGGRTSARLSEHSSTPRLDAVGGAWSRAARALLALALIPLGGAVARADSGGVAVGEVSTTVGHAEVVPAIKATLTDELSRMRPAAGRSYVVNANLVKLGTTKGTRRRQAIISLALRDAKGNLRGVVEGTASAERASDRELVEAATKGGSKAVAEYVAK